ncbi:hypothetical protein AN965_13085 [Alkalicoccobacillus plakortidis]|uniref:Uncharacterized protein n=1 Tax=Alkalicoccobacillus plakortidis TaxID=444060 RepID=A0A9D5DPF0_9BACI|nr:hypothetical protein AN965_13085 [Alkalicoccobacillus plakortidis]
MYTKKEAGTKVDRQTKMTNIPENRNVRRLFYMNMSGRRIRRLLGDQHVSEDAGVAVFHGEGCGRVPGKRRILL